MRVNHTAKSQKRGFTLIEIVVAFAILGIAGGMITSIVGANRTKLARLENERLAIMQAQSMMNQINNQLPLSLGEYSGRSSYGKQAWTVTISPFQDGQVNQDASDKGIRSQLYMIEVQTSSGEGSAAAAANLISVRSKMMRP